MQEKASDNLPKQLEGLFTGLFDTRSLKPRDQERLKDLYGKFPRGWAWEADDEGILLWVSPEVEKLMGFAPENLIGRSILAFANSPDSAEDLQIALSSKKSIRNLYIEAISREGNTLTLLINGLARSTGKPPITRYRGVAQVIGVTEKLVESVVMDVPEVSPVPLTAPSLGFPAGFAIVEDQIQSASAVDGAEIPMVPSLSNGQLQVPILNPRGDPIGIVEFERKPGDPLWIQGDIDLVTEVTRQLAIAIQDVRSNLLTQQALNDVREADQLKSQFLANMTHELRTPLNSIIGFSRVILKGIDGPITETQKHDLNAIYKAGQHLLGLINNILDFSKIDSGRMELSLSEIDLKDIVRDVMATATGLVKDKPVKLVTEIDDDLPTILADSVRTRQILLNLISNAAKFTDIGEIGVKVQLNTEENGLLIAVFDTGTGISSQDQRKLFEPFSQLDISTSRRIGGTGLGLSICRHLVELQGGRIWVESTPGIGSTFFFTIPLLTDERAVEVTSKAPIIFGLSSNQEKLQHLEKILQSETLQFQSASNPEKFLDVATELQPKAILIDPTMPDGAGWKLLVKLKSEPMTRSIPINTFSLSENMEKGFNLSVGDYLSKPVQAADLQIAVRFLLTFKEWELDTLIIDNIDEDLHALERQFQSHFPGEIRTATSGFEGLIAARQQIPDLIVLSLFMAKADGFRMMEALRVDERTRDVPIILLIPQVINETHLRQLKLWTNHNFEKANLSLEAFVEQLRERLDRLEPSPE
jgi:PAS domain S-box-containing protein